MRNLILGALLCSACGGSSAGPSPVPVPTPTPTTITLSGTVHATNGGQPLPGVQAALGSIAAMTDGAGAFTAQMPPAGSLSLALTGSGIVPRTLYVAAASSRSVTVDAISTSGFDLNFYRQMVRNGFESTTLQPLRRWTRAPQIYLRTVDDAGIAIDAKTLDSTEAAIRDTAPLWTAGRFAIADLTRGTETRKGVSGWITVTWPAVAEIGACAHSDVGLEGGTIDLNYKNGGGCRCDGGPEIRPRTVRHELGHAFGFWHTDSVSDLMSGRAVAGCDAQPSARELAAAAIAYQRPVGNMDPDTDAPGTVNLAPMRVR